MLLPLITTALARIPVEAGVRVGAGRGRGTGGKGGGEKGGAGRGRAVRGRGRRRVTHLEAILALLHRIDSRVEDIQRRVVALERGKVIEGEVERTSKPLVVPKGLT